MGCCNNENKEHFNKDCKTLKKSGDGGEDRNHSTNASTKEAQGNFLILSLDNTKMWIVNSSTSFHGRPNKNVFQN